MGLITLSVEKISGNTREAPDFTPKFAQRLGCFLEIDVRERQTKNTQDALPFLVMYSSGSRNQKAIQSIYTKITFSKQKLNKYKQS